MSTPFDDALREVRGESWLDQAARSSLRAAAAKFSDAPSEPLLKVQLKTSRTLGAYDTATVSMALQDAAAKLGHQIRDSSREWTQSRRSDREEALLVPRGQAGGTLFFSFAPAAARLQESLLPEHRSVSVAEAAVRELCELLPSTDEDDAAIDAVFGQRTTARNAISDVVNAVTQTASDLVLDFTTIIGEAPVHSLLTTQHAQILQEGLRESRTDRRVQVIVGRLDGVRTRRRIFYLELDDGEEIHGAIPADTVLMGDIRQYLDRRVQATVESSQVETMAGRRRRATYQLIRLEPEASLFDE